MAPADIDLIEELGRRNAHVTRFQLERWRQRGLLPRALVSHHATGSSTELTADSVDTAEVLAAFSGRGRPWQLSVVWLYQFGLVPSEQALRETAAWMMARTERTLARTLSEIAIAPAADELAAVEALVSSRARRKAARPLRRSLLEVIRSRHPHMSQRELRQRADAAELWSTYFLLHPGVRGGASLDLLAVADGFEDAAEAKAYGWSPRERSSFQRTKSVAPTVTRPEMRALAHCYDYLEGRPGFEYLERGAFRFEHALADVAMFRRNHSRNLRTPVNPAVIYNFFDLDDDELEPS